MCCTWRTPASTPHAGEGLLADGRLEHYSSRYAPRGRGVADSTAKFLQSPTVRPTRARGCSSYLQFANSDSCTPHAGEGLLVLTTFPKMEWLVRPTRARGLSQVVKLTTSKRAPHVGEGVKVRDSRSCPDPYTRGTTTPSGHV